MIYIIYRISLRFLSILKLRNSLLKIFNDNILIFEYCENKIILIFNKRKSIRRSIRELLKFIKIIKINKYKIKSRKSKFLKMRNFISIIFSQIYLRKFYYDFYFF